MFSGKSCGKESPDKKDDSELWSNVEAQAAFLGPNLWEKTLSYDSDLKVSAMFCTEFECKVYVALAHSYYLCCTLKINVIF